MTPRGCRPYRPASRLRVQLDEQRTAVRVLAAAVVLTGPQPVAVRGSPPRACSPGPPRCSPPARANTHPARSVWG